jgi:hypothetical protein
MNTTTTGTATTTTAANVFLHSPSVLWTDQGMSGLSEGMQQQAGSIFKGLSLQSPSLGYS